MSSLEQEALDRKARLAILRQKRSAGDKEVNQHGTAPASETFNKKAKLVQRNFHENAKEEQEQIEKLVLKSGETVETVSAAIEKEVLDKYKEAFGESRNIDAGKNERKKERDEQKKKSQVYLQYEEKLRLQDLKLAKMTKLSIEKLREDLSSSA